MNFISFFDKRPLSVFIFFICSTCCNHLYSQETEHPTIANLQVSYNIDPVSEFVTDSMTRVRSSLKIELHNTAAVSSIHLNVKSEASDVLLYSVTYSVTPDPVTNDAGMVLYRQDQSTIYIITPDCVTLTLYKYEVTTEDSGAVVSPVYSSIQ